MLDLLTDATGRAAGLTLHVMGEGAARRRRRGTRAGRRARHRRPRARCSPRPPTRRCPPATAWRSRCAPGRRSRDLEFVQFHPTVLWLGDGAPRPAAADLRGGARRGRPPGRRRGQRFMPGQHELAELAPRDIVAKAITRQMPASRAPTTCSSTRRHFGAEMWRGASRPSWPSCRAHGIDPVTRPDPGRPGRALRLRRRPAPTCAAAPRSRACTPAARSPAPACTARTGWPPTPCSKAWCSPTGSADDLARAFGPDGDDAPGEPAAGHAVRRSCSTLRSGPRRSR